MNHYDLVTIILHNAAVVQRLLASCLQSQTHTNTHTSVCIDEDKN